jgi:NUMOD3 motif
MAHCWRAKNKPVTYFHRAIAKHGSESFSVVQIATCLRVEDAFLVERLVIADRQPDYNQTNGGEFTVGKRASSETVEKIRIANTGKKRTPEQNAAMSQLRKQLFIDKPEILEKTMANLKKAIAAVDQEVRRKASSESSRNRIWSDESRAKLSASQTGKRHTPEVLSRISAKKSKPVECIDLACTFDSGLDAAATTGVYFSNISRVCRSGKGTAGGMRFRFV